MIIQKENLLPSSFTDINTVHKTTDIINLGFKKVGTIATLLSCELPYSEELSSCGVYAITKQPDYYPYYFTPEESRINGNVIRPWSLDKLSAKWVADTDIIYIGLAGAKSARSLRSRLSDLIRHCSGKVSDRGPHKGGEIIWQLKGYEEFVIWIFPTENPPIPRLIEELLLKKFFETTGQLPFANRQF